jgi:hypothetical protein
VTALIAINTRDAIIMGTDSLGTITKPMIDPNELAEYFEAGNGFKLKLRKDGSPLLDNWSKIIQKTQTVPSNYYNHIEKIFSLAPREMGVMCSGIGAIGDRSIKSLIGEFCSSAKTLELKDSEQTLFRTGEELLDFLWEHYSKVFPDEKDHPDLEFMLCGYDRNKYTPGMVRVHVHDHKVFVPDYDFCIFFGGITKEIQRLIFGTDMYNKLRLIDRSAEILTQYHEFLTKDLNSRGIQIPLKRPEDFKAELDLFHNWHLEGLAANWGTFSEQTAIECVDFLINVMVRSQEYSTQIPTVGGEVQIALVKKNLGFQPISKLEWRHGDRAVLKPGYP